MISSFYIYLIVLFLSLATVFGSMYGMGKHDHEKNSAGYVSASVFFNISLITLLLSLVLIIKDSQAYKFCSSNDLFTQIEPESIEDVASTLVNTPEVSLKEVSLKAE